MAALASPPLPSIMPLEQALSDHNLQKSHALYNSLKDDESQPDVSNEHIQNLASLFVHHNAEKVFGIHLIHGHFQIPEGNIIVGTSFKEPNIRWAKTIPFDEFDRCLTHGHIFVVNDDGLCAYEFENGPLPDLAQVSDGFLNDFSKYIAANNLTALIGLQVLVGEDMTNHGMSELILDQGTVMLDSALVKNCWPSRITGWAFESMDGQPRTRQSNETHSRMTSGNHKVFNAGKPLPKLDNVEDLKAALVEAGVM